MGTIPEAAVARFAKLARELGEEGGAKTAYREGFGTGSLFVGKKMFGVLDTCGALVVKLPPARVQELIAGGVGAPWHPGSGTPLKEYVATGFDRQAKWLALSREAREYMGSKK